jgi:hydrogenase maturation protease
MHLDANGPAAHIAPSVLVLGVGNVLLRDDGVGIRVLRRLQRDLGDDVRVRFVDGGTMGFMISAYIEDLPSLLVIDAVRMAESPGSVRCFEDDAMDRFLTGARNSVHELGLRDALDMARLTGRFPQRRALVGVEPASIELGDELSPEVTRSLEPALALAHDVLQRWLGTGSNVP